MSKRDQLIRDGGGSGVFCVDHVSSVGGSSAVSAFGQESSIPVSCHFAPRFPADQPPALISGPRSLTPAQACLFSPHPAMDNSGKEKEAMQLLAEADKKIKSSQSFFSGLFG